MGLIRETNSTCKNIEIAKPGSYPPPLVAAAAGHKGVNSCLQRSDVVPVGLCQGTILGLLSEGGSSGSNGSGCHVRQPSVGDDSCCERVYHRVVERTLLVSVRTGPPAVCAVVWYAGLVVHDTNGKDSISLEAIVALDVRSNASHENKQRFHSPDSLVNGGTLIMADNRSDPAEIAALMAAEKVTCTTLVVSEMKALLKYGYDRLCNCSSWRISMVAGEAFTVQLLEQFRALNRSDLKVINAYGPTEASICSSLGEVSFEELSSTEVSIPIGKAIANYGTYIVDRDCNPVPVGWPGEVAIAGPGVASGYLNLPALTQTKFKTSASLGGLSKSGLIYLTGDKGRMLSDGSIVISGRVDGDDQVKVRGHRVQLADVATALIQTSRGVFADAAVLLKGDDPMKQHLIAYIVFSRSSSTLDKETYFRQLIQELPIPAYMRPVLIIPLDILPMSERGMLDTKELSLLPLPRLSLDESLDEQLTSTEARVRDLWKHVLGDITSSIPIRRSSDFFSVGGNSLLLLPLKAEISRSFGVDIPIPEIFQASTLELLAARLDGTSLLAQIAWDKETDLDQMTFTPPIASNGVNGRDSPISDTKKISVLLTRATGFLGDRSARDTFSPTKKVRFCKYSSTTSTDL
ncbi:unnamed protein product [Penicillium viridicatum]